MIKLKIYKHSSLKTNIDDDLIKVTQYFSSDFVNKFIKEEIVYDIENTNKNYKDDTLFKPNEDTYDTVMFIYEQGVFPVYGSTYPYSDKLRVCYVSVNPLEDKIDYSWKVIAHELLHSLVFKIMAEKKVYIPNLLDYSSPTPYYKNDDPYAVVGNFSQQLNSIKQYYISGWKHFKPGEFTNTQKTHTVSELKPELVDKLDIIRGECGFPFVINSGYRTLEENATLKDSVVDSAHTTGEAVDIYCTDSTKRIKIIIRAYMNGITRIGISKTFIHLDIDKTKPQNVIWLY